MFYYSAATSPHGASQWLIWLQGGGWCWSTESCASRVSSVPQFTSTLRYGEAGAHVAGGRAAGSEGGGVFWQSPRACECETHAEPPPFPLLSSPRQMHMGGVFDTDPKRNPFAEVNKVLVGYCSSDAWAGDTDNLIGENWMRFRGQRILSAVVQTLQASYGMDAARSVVMGGCHEGARGAMYNTQNMAALMPVGSDFRVVIDSGYELDTAPFDGGANPLELAEDVQNQTAAAYQFLNATGVVGDTPCGATYDLSTPWKCLFPPYRLPLLGGTPRFMSIMSQFDSWQLPRSAGSSPPYSTNNTALMAYLTSFQRGVRSAALQLPTSGQSGSAIFSSACYSTCTTLSGAFWNVRVNNITASEYLASWWGGSGRPVNQLLVNTPQLIESCNGFGCGQCASLTFAPAPPLPPARKGLQAPPTAGSGYPPVGFVASKLGYTPGETYQQRQKAREQAREEKRETSRYSVTTVRVIHAAAALCVVLLCILARPVFKAANKAAGPGRTGTAELTPLVSPGGAARPAQQFYKPVRQPQPIKKQGSPGTSSTAVTRN